MRNKHYRSLTGIMARSLFWGVLIAFLILPMVWIVSVSFQSLSGLSGKYSIIPQHPDFEAYRTALTKGSDIRASLLYSTYFSALSSVLAICVALASAYVVTAHTMSLKWRKQIVFTGISLFFLPAFAVFPGVRQIEKVIPAIRQPTVELVMTQSVQAFPVAFILLLFLFASLPKTDFEQLLLETNSRVKSFWFGVVARRPAAIAAIATITFAAVWSEFYVTGLITTKQTIQPFSVLLLKAQQQYRTDYSVPAAGAVVSLIITLGAVILGYLFILGTRTIRRRIDELRHRA